MIKCHIPKGQSLKGVFKQLTVGDNMCNVPPGSRLVPIIEKDGKPFEGYLVLSHAQWEELQKLKNK